jgi:ribonucleoside-diphosphate reductase alpha chain
LNSLFAFSILPFYLTTMPLSTIQKRSGDLVEFDRHSIEIAIEKATRSVQPKASTEYIIPLTDKLVEDLEQTFGDRTPSVEDIQDRVEKALMEHGFFDIAKAYILYREKHKEQREQEQKELIEKMDKHEVLVQKRDGSTVPFDTKALAEAIQRAIKGYEDIIDANEIAEKTKENLFDGVTTEEIDKAVVMVMKARIQQDPAYSYATAQVFLNQAYKEAFGPFKPEAKEETFNEGFKKNLKLAVENELLNPELLTFDLDKLANALQPENDRLFTYLGAQTLYDRYFIHVNKRRIETPQTMWMRVAMGLSLQEKNREEKAIEFYNLYSNLLYLSSTPTLFNSGTLHSQLSSCYLSTINDDLGHIFKCIGDDAQLSKWAGGLGNDWTDVRATGSRIKGTNGESQGVIPFLKIANDTAVAVNQGGKRKGAMCAYLECWHLDVEDFLELRKNTGDERRRTHDMNTANWIPDLFMQRVQEDGDWTLFTPSETPDLHHIYGQEFKEKYEYYEQLTHKLDRKDAPSLTPLKKTNHKSTTQTGNPDNKELFGASAEPENPDKKLFGASDEPENQSENISHTNNPITIYKTVKAKDLWRKMLTMLFETGHPWITFKDPCNIRSPQDHVGVVHNSNLCTEITLNTSKEETAVCNLGSVNLGRHIVDGKLDTQLLQKTVSTAMRMLDNVININFYPTKEAENSNKKHRPVGLGVMGLHDALYKLDLNFESEEAVAFSNEMMEQVSYTAILTSSELAKEKGVYPSYKGSKWSRNILPIDTLDLLEKERGEQITTDRIEKLDWEKVRLSIKEHGMRNSNCMAIAPTATISNIAGCVPCIEPIYKNLYVKSNLSGEFTVINPYLIDDLKEQNLWNNEMAETLKFYDGNIQRIETIPQKLKDKYKEVFEINPSWLIQHAAVRGKWIDQSQSLNIFIKGVSGKKLNDIYFQVWKAGLKTTYYLRSMGASQVEKSTVDSSKFGFTHRRGENKTVIATDPSPVIARSEATRQSPELTDLAEQKSSTETMDPQAAKENAEMCSILNGPDCEACQ